jgi:peptidoglycan/xylan/chitin deacetylase (PgdA/CDA1 family)
MRNAGMSVGSHGRTHRNLAELDGHAALSELLDSKHALEDRLGDEVTTVAYPYGLPGRHVKRSTLDAAAAAGYVRGMSILYRSVAEADEPLALPRFAIKNNPLRIVQAKVEGRLDVIGRWQERRAAWAANGHRPYRALPEMRRLKP